MGVTSEILGNSGSPHQIEYKDKTYCIRLIDQDVQSAWEKRLYEKDCASVHIQREQGLLSEDKYAAKLDQLAESFSNGDYEMLSPRGLALLSSVPGARLLLSLLIDCPQKELFALILGKQTEILSLLHLVMQESFPGVDFSKVASSAASNLPASENASPNAV